MATITREQVLRLIQIAGWIVIGGLCLTVGLLWGRMDRQVARNQEDIAELKAYVDLQDRRFRDESTANQQRLENRWGTSLMPLLRQHHHTLESLLAPDGVMSRPETRTPMPPLPDWLRE